MVNRNFSISMCGRACLILIAVISGGICFGTAVAQDNSFNPRFPRLATGQVGTAQPYDADRREMISRYHLTSLAGWRQMTSDGLNVATLPGAIKELNPEIKIFQYINPTQTFHSGATWQFVREKISREKALSGAFDWWLRDASGAVMVSTWSDTLWRINFTPSVTRDADGLIYPEWYARYIDAAPTDTGDWVEGSGRGHKEGNWDGVFIDDVFISAWWGMTADYNGDGRNDDKGSDFVRNLVMDGNIAFVKEWRRLHPDRLVIANLSNLTDPSENPLPEKMRGLYNGGPIEGLTRSEAWGGWDTMMATYRRALEYTLEPKLVMFDHNIKTTRQRYPNPPQSEWSDYRWNRYFLASALMDNGYYKPLKSLSTVEWFDEFDIDLGYAVDPPQLAAWSRGVYRREFDNGLVLVNPKGNGTQTVTVGDGWKRFVGTQDPVHNNGDVTTVITLEAQDGIVLIRTTAASPPKPPPVLVE